MFIPRLTKCFRALRISTTTTNHTYNGSGNGATTIATTTTTTGTTTPYSYPNGGVGNKIGRWFSSISGSDSITVRTKFLLVNTHPNPCNPYGSHGYSYFTRLLTQNGPTKSKINNIVFGWTSISRSGWILWIRWCSCVVSRSYYIIIIDHRQRV